MPEMLRVSGSSNLDAYGYDPAMQELYIRFRKRDRPADTYVYQNVSQEFYEEFRASSSKGQFVQHKIRGNAAFPYRKLPASQP